MTNTIWRWATALRCRFGNHELITAPVDADPERGTPAVLRFRCLHCRAVTSGWVIPKPGYHVTQPADPDKLTIPNPRTAPVALPAAVGDSRKPLKFRLARKDRSR